MHNAENLDGAFDILDELKSEVHSLKNYELKLVFPGVERYFGDVENALPQNIRINELHDLLRKKEDFIKDKILELEIEIEEIADCHALEELVAYFKDSYFCKKEIFYRGIAKLRKEKAGSANDDHVVKGSLPA